MIAYITAFTAGLASFFTPCVLPLLPGYLSLISGFSAKELSIGEHRAATRKAVINSLFFTAGFSIAFSLLGAAASSIGNILFEYKDILLKVLGFVLFFMGIHMTGILNFKFLNYEKRLSMKKIKPGHLGSFLMGFAFALGWSPCIGPILAGILALAAGSDKIYEGVALLFVYSIGLAIPFILSALLTAKFFQWIAEHKKTLFYTERVAGIIIAILGILLFFNKLNF
ncbi:MAG: cytochrome c biogenesis CcdA family protein [Elusimicrobiota bacterium]|nr:cytochrome c biogenesis CcdA family protein [Elusimicrobiota bacterium]